MTGILIALITGILYIVAYNTYGKYLATKIFKINPEAETPAITLRDDKDYLPTKKHILFGHHFTSIAGTGPIVGPAIAIIWGWLPALLWVVLGSILMGAVHDFGTMLVSIRNEGRSIGDVAGRLMGKKVYLLFMSIIFITLWIVLAVFGLVIAAVFSLYPQSVIPVWFEIPIALILGYIIYKKQGNVRLWSIIAVISMYATIVIGAYVPLQMPDLFGIPSLIIWLTIIFIYIFIASILPVGALLQPRDYLNGHQLMIAMGLLFVGLMVAHPEMAAPVVNMNPEGAPPIFPFLFITVACGAISGSHSVIGSGTSSKQIANERHAKLIGFGGMLLEGFLAVIVILVIGTGLGMKYEFLGSDGVMNVLTGKAAFAQHYGSWNAAQGLGQKLGAFVQGSANLLNTIGIPRSIAIALMGMFIASFAGTSVDTVMRLQSYVVRELATEWRIKPFQNKINATLFATVTAILLALIPVKDPLTGSLVFGKGGLLLWPLLATANQLIAALSLTVLTVYLIKKKVNWIVTAVPMVVMVVITGWALVLNIQNYLETGKYHLFIIGVLIFAMEILIVFEGVKFFKKSRGM